MTPSHDHSHKGHSHAPGAERWKHDGVRVIPGDQLDPNVPSTPGMDRKAAINFARAGAQKLWAGTVTIKPDAKTGAHHHGHLESIIYGARQGAHALGRAFAIHRRGQPWRFHLHPARPMCRIRRSMPAP